MGAGPRNHSWDLGPREERACPGHTTRGESRLEPGDLAPPGSSCCSPVYNSTSRVCLALVLCCGDLKITYPPERMAHPTRHPRRKE